MNRRSEICAGPRRVGNQVRAATAADLLGSVAGNNGKPVKIKSKWTRHYERLLQLREQFMSGRAGLAKEACEAIPGYGLHMADAATDNFYRDFALSLLSADQDALYEIEQAMKRIENDTYGFCELTGQPISRQRLEAIPWTRFSVEAERQLEKEGAVSPNRLRPRESVTGANLEESVESEESEEPETKPYLE